MKHPRVSKKQIAEDLKRLSNNELKIYNSIMRVFPSTHHLTAYDYAIQGGIRFQFIPS